MQRSLVNNRYTLADLLGSGGMGRVYLAHDEVLNRDVALKVLRNPYAESEEFIERFRREARSAAALSHPNIVSVYDLGRAGDGTYHIAMEYVPGGTLKDRIVADGPLDPGTAAELGSQVAEALGLAHKRGVIHRDIKPQNILLSASGEAKVADFGIARAAAAATISQTGRILGTARYMSPEQAVGTPARPASDLYSLGVILYEVLTGEVPFEAETLVGIAVKHVEEPPRPPKEVNPEVPEGMNALVLKLLAKKPEDRYRGASELARDLRRIRGGLPPLAADTSNDVSAGAAEGNGTNRAATSGPPVVPGPPDEEGNPPAAPYRGVRGRLFRRPRVLATLTTLLAVLGALVWGLPQEDDVPSSSAPPAAEPGTSYDAPGGETGEADSGAGIPSGTNGPPSSAPQAVASGQASAAAAEVVPPAAEAAPVEAEAAPVEAEAAPAAVAPRASATGAPSAGSASQTPVARATPVPAADVSQILAPKEVTTPTLTAPPAYEKRKEGEKTQKEVKKRGGEKQEN